ncbi:pathogenesis-related homeodomain protein [Lactuca sativa]|uniref:PHD-type domain-containing protein n=1 Tax=Lactuca sativa TaxID=4236 RepID=A0A9R1UHI8_LACSA|nr:pathogenesis-related homeodomain protein [Lactuca sativa]KAJ0187143.1 hypothetical protein LSAT_V11C900500800 [Lactuca sativa]
MANHKSNEVVNGTPTQGDVSKESGQKKGQTRKKEKIGTHTPRVLRTRSQEKPKAPESVDPSPQDQTSTEKKRKKIKKIKKDQNDEFSKIRAHLRYLLQKMSYEQLFIDAYVGEGWKGQSLEKIRPEKELQRAKSDINRFKLRIRDLFQKIDKSCEEGRFPDTLYDSDGLIDSEDIFCAKCAQTEVKLDNDIILCDGFCDRGFHQFCLDPPLLKEQVPPGDEGWLCPACDCKVDCVDLLNDSMGTDLSINDTWEKVFPETAVSGDNLNDISGLPSDDSEDDDYNPDAPQVAEDEVDVEDPSSDESDDSDFSSASEDLGAIANNNNNNNNNEEQYLGLPSDDSEDDDFNPDKADSDDDDDDDHKAKSSGSDFTSDSEDLGDISKNEVTSAEVVKESVVSEKDEEILKTDMENDDSAPITARRHVQRLDYKKLHDEAYGNVSSDSSDEDFSDSEGPKRRKNTKEAKGEDLNKKQKESDSTTPVRKNGKKVDVEGKNGTSARKGSSAAGSGDKSGAKSSNKKLGEAVTKRLYEIFKENKYPNRNIKENLMKELNLTLNQVSKWFENARRSSKHPEQHKSGVSTPTPGPTPEKSTAKQVNLKKSTTKQENVEKSTTKQENGEKSTAKQENGEKSTTKQENGEKSTPIKSSKRKAKGDNEDMNLKDANSSPLDLSSQSARRSGRVRAKRV